MLKLHLINVKVCGAERAAKQEDVSANNRQTHTHTLASGLFLKDTGTHMAYCRMLVGESVSYQHEVAQTSTEQAPPLEEMFGKVKVEFSSPFSCQKSPKPSS